MSASSSGFSDELFVSFGRWYRGASAKAIRNAEEALQVELPPDYVSFLRSYNGGEGTIGETYLVLWKAEELAEMNQSYRATEFVPELLLIGSDGGGEAFAFDKRTAPWGVVMVPFIGLEMKCADSMGATFTEFLNSLASP